MKNIFSLITVLLVTAIAYGQLDRSTAPQAGPAPKIQIGNYERFELKNGLKVFVVENHKVPVVSYSLSLDIDPLMEGETAGHVQMTGTLLRAGTASRSKSEIDEAIDFIGASLSTSPKGIYANALKKHSATLLDLMTDVLYHPTFPQEELDKNKKKWITGIQTEKDDPGTIANNVGAVLKYGKEHPYGEIESEQSIENITTDNCKAYYQTYFRPNVAYLVIVGDITVKEAKKQAKTYFSQWERADVPTHNYQFPKAYSQPQYVVSHKEGANQSTINVTYAIDLKPGSEDAVKAKVMNQVLGGGSFSARLFANLREDKAYTYGAYSSLSSNELVGTFKASSSVRGEITDSALTEVIYEMNRMKTDPVDEKDLQLVKNSLMGSFSRSLEDPKTVARFAVNIEKYNLPKDYYQTYLERLEKVTSADIMEMANKYLLPEKAIILAVGDVNNIKPLMARIANGAPVTEYDYYGNKVTPLTLPANLKSADVIKKYTDAIGGTEALNKVKNIALIADMKLQGMQMQLTTKQKAPDKLLVVVNFNGQTVEKQVFDGTSGNKSGMRGSHAVEGDELGEMKYNAVIFPELNFESMGITPRLAGVEKIAGEIAYKIVINIPGGKEKTMYYSKKTGLKVKEITSGAQGAISTIFKNYQEKSGILFPIEIVQTAGPQVIKILVKELKVNQEINDSEFQI